MSFEESSSFSILHSITEYIVKATYFFRNFKKNSCLEKINTQNMWRITSFGIYNMLQ